jgi:hypothetical protein
MRSWMARTVPCLAAACLAAASARAEEPHDPHDGGAASRPVPRSAAQIEEARRHMKAGAAFYYDPRGHRCEEALREFRTAYEISGSLNALKGMAVCDLELERDGDAIQHYTAYLAGRRGALDPAERAQIEADLNALRSAVATVKLSADREGVLVTDVRTPAQGSPIRNTYTLEAGPELLGVHPGEHVFTASADGAADQTWRVEIANGGSYTHAFALGDAGQARPVPVAAWATLGLTAALTIPWVALMVRARNKEDDYEKANGREPAATLNALRGDVTSANLLADAFLGATAASLTATLVLFLTRPGRPARSTITRGSFTIAPQVGVSSGGAVASGLF